MIWGILGVIGTVAGVATVGNALINIISTGAWKSWGIGDWLFNIVCCVLAIWPFYSTFKGAAAVGTAVGGGILGKLIGIPVLGKIVGWVYGVYVIMKEAILLLINPFMTKGGFLWKIGQAIEKIGRGMMKHPWIAFGLLLSSQMFDGLMREIFQVYGDMSMRAASFMYENLSHIMSDKRYGDPISDAIAILDGSRSTLPPCFTAIWGAVGATECIGLIITTFQYLFLYAALVKGFKVAGHLS